METGTNTSATNPTFNQLRGLFEYLKSYKVTLLISVLLCLLAACVYQLYDQPVYRVNSILYVEGVQSNADDKVPAEKNLKSPDILQKAIEESPLMVSYEVSDGANLKEINRNASPVNVRVKRIEPGFYKKKITIRILDENSFEIASKGFDKTYAFNKMVHFADADFKVTRRANEEYLGDEIQIRFNNPNELTSAYAKKLNINSDAKNKNKLVLSVTDSHPQKGIDFLNTLSSVYASLQKPDNADKRKQIISIEDSIRILRDELASLNRKKLDNITRKKETKPIAVVQKKVSEKQKQTFKVLQSYLDKPVENFVQLPENYVTSDADLDRQIALYNDLQLRKQKNSEDLAALADIEKAKASIESRIQSYYSPAKEQPENVATVSYTTVSHKESGKTQAIRQSKLSQLNKLASERKTIMANTDSPKISVVEKPSYSRIPLVFEATLLYLGAVLIGLVLPMPVIYAKNIMTKTILSVSDIENLSNVPLIGYFSHHGKETDKASSIADFGRYKYELSGMIKQLENMAVTKGGKVVAISSYISGEGKSYFANHLAISLAGMGKKLVFVDVNLMNYSGNDHAGVINYISDKNLTEEDVLVSSPKYPKLFFIGAGTSEKKKVADDLPFYQWEVGKTEHKRMESQRLKKLITQLKKKFDYVILDTPSFNQEPAVVAVYPLADVRLHMVRYNFTKKTFLKTSVVDNPESGQRTFIVFNDIKHTSPQFYKTLNSTYQA